MSNLLLISVCASLLSAFLVHSSNRNECPLGPYWTAEGKDVMDEKYGLIVLLALLELQCQDCVKQLNGLMALQRLVDKNNYERTQILVVTPWNEPRTSVEYWRARLKKAGIDLVQEDQDQPVSRILAGKGHDFFVFDRCGRIAFHVPYPQSFLYYHYTISVVHNTYQGWCGPCPPYKLPRLRTTAPYYNHPEQSTRPSFIVDATALSTVNAVLHNYKVRPGESDEHPDYVLLPSSKSEKPNESGTKVEEIEIDAGERNSEDDEEGNGLRPKGKGKKGKGKGNKGKGSKRPKGWRRKGKCPPRRPNCKRGRGGKGRRLKTTTTTMSTSTSTFDPDDDDSEWYDYGKESTVDAEGRSLEQGKPKPNSSVDYSEEEGLDVHNQAGVEGGRGMDMVTTSPKPTPYFMPYEIPGVDCSIFSDNYCYTLQQKRKPIHPCCYKGVYLTNLCVPGKCSNETYHVCCFQRFHQARFRCCNDNSLNCEAPDEFSRCCYEIFAKDPKEVKEDPCCPASVARRHWNIESRVVEYCVPNLELNYGRMELRAQMKDHSSVRIKLSEFKPLHYQCPYAQKNSNCDPYYYQPEYDANDDSEYN